MRPASSRAHGKLENFRVVETRRDVTTFSLETLRVANHVAGYERERECKPGISGEALGCVLNGFVAGFSPA